MLLVRAKAAPSRIHGMGLIAQEFIPADTIIWRFMLGFDVQVPKHILERLSAPAREQLLYYAYFNKETGLLVLSSDDDRFTNHSNDANTIIVNDDVMACRDIEQGEEITTNYRELTMFHSLDGEPDWLRDDQQAMPMAG